MSICNALDKTEATPRILQVGFFVGLAGGSAEIIVIWFYSVLTGGDAAMVARHIASAVGLDGSSATAGLAIHMSLAVALGIALSTAVQMLAGLLTRDGAIFCFMVGSLAAVWAINYFVILPIVSPGFVNLLPFALTLASKLAFGVAAAMALDLFKVRKLSILHN